MQTTTITTRDPATGVPPARVTQRIDDGIDLSLGLWRRAICLLLGFFFAGATLYVLLGDYWNGLGGFTTKHLMTIVAVVGTIAAGHFVGPTWRQKRYLTSVGFALAFAGGTIICVIGSAGRADEAAYARNADARKVNNDRARAERDRDEAKRRYNDAMTAETLECSGGDGFKCKAKRTLTSQRRADFDSAELAVKMTAPEKRENGELAKAAEMIAEFSGWDQNTVLRKLVLLWPFLPPFLAEILTIAFVHMAFASGHGARRAPKVAAAPATVAIIEAEAAQPSQLLEKPWQPFATLPATLPTVARMGTQDLRNLARDYLRNHGTLPSQAELVRLSGANKGTVSKVVKELEDSGFLSRSRDGRRNVIVHRTGTPTLTVVAK